MFTYYCHCNSKSILFGSLLNHLRNCINCWIHFDIVQVCCYRANYNNNLFMWYIVLLIGFLSAQLRLTRHHQNQWKCTQKVHINKPFNSKLILIENYYFSIVIMYSWTMISSSAVRDQKKRAALTKRTDTPMSLRTMVRWFKD